MKMDISAIWIVTSVYHHPSVYDDVVDAVEEAVYRLKDPMEPELKVGDYVETSLLTFNGPTFEKKVLTPPKKFRYRD